jgi:hypothetical protein
MSGRLLRSTTLLPLVFGGFCQDFVAAGLLRCNVCKGCLMQHLIHGLDTQHTQCMLCGGWHTGNVFLTLVAPASGAL